MNNKTLAHVSKRNITNVTFAQDVVRTSGVFDIAAVVVDPLRMCRIQALQQIDEMRDDECGEGEHDRHGVIIIELMGVDVGL